MEGVRGGCEKIQLLGEQSVLKILGSTFMEVIEIYLPGPGYRVECVCDGKESCGCKREGVCAKEEHVCIEKKCVVKCRSKGVLAVVFLPNREELEEL